MRTFGFCSALVATSFAALAFSISSTSHAEEASTCTFQGEPEPPSSPTPADIKNAQRLFSEGRLLEQAGLLEKALEKYLESRRLVPRKSTTKNAAILFEKLDRAHEAAAMFENLLVRFSSGLSAEEQAQIQSEIAQLKAKIGTFHFERDQGALFVDGKPCGTLPRNGELYVLPGKHELELRRLDTSVYWVGVATPRERRDIRFPPPPPPPGPRWNVNASMGLLLGPGMKSDVELQATHCGADCPFALGGLFLLRVEQELKHNVFIGVGTGYLEGASSFFRQTTAPLDASIPTQASNPLITYNFNETVRLRGPFMGLLLGYRYPLGRFELSAHSMIGLLSAQSVEEFNTAETARIRGLGAVPVLVHGEASVTSVTPLFMPDIGVEMNLGKVRVGFALGATFTLEPGSMFNSRTYEVEAGHCTETDPTSNPGCAARPEAPLPKGASHGKTYFIHPQIVIALAP